MERLSFQELCNYLETHEERIGVIVFKQNKNWQREYTEPERSYMVSGNNRYFQKGKISNSLFGTNLTKDDCGVRLDWYMFNGEDSWEVDYCYILEDEA